MTLHLNKSQARVLAIQEDLSSTDTDRLEEFIGGVATTEPPKYQWVGDKIEPPLARVSIKEGAKNYDIGNVVFPDKQNIVLHTEFTIHDGKPKAAKHEAIPASDDNPLSVPIQKMPATSLYVLWRKRYEAILEHIGFLNSQREYAFNLRQQRKKEPVSPVANPAVAPDNSRKRKLGDAVQRLAMAKKMRVRSGTQIPDDIKIKLFDEIAGKTAPTNDNLVNAALNVVAVYQAYGSPFSDVHDAVAVLEAVLDEMKVDDTEDTVKPEAIEHVIPAINGMHSKATTPGGTPEQQSSSHNEQEHVREPSQDGNYGLFDDGDQGASQHEVDNSSLFVPEHSPEINHYQHGGNHPYSDHENVSPRRTSRQLPHEHGNGNRQSPVERATGSPGTQRKKKMSLNRDTNGQSSRTGNVGQRNMANALNMEHGSG